MPAWVGAPWRHAVSSKRLHQPKTRGGLAAREVRRVLSRQTQRGPGCEPGPLNRRLAEIRYGVHQ